MNTIKIALHTCCVFISTLLIQSNCFAQTWLIKNPMTTSYGMFVVPNGIYVIGSDKDTFEDPAALKKYDFLGTKQTETFFSDVEYWHTAEIRSIDTIPNTKDLAVLAIATLGATNTFILARIDSAGGVTWKKSFSDAYMSDPVIVDASSFPGQIITLTANSNDFLEYNLWDGRGVNLDSRPLGLGVWLSGAMLRKPITKVNDGYIVFCQTQNNSGYRMVKVSPDGDIIFNKTFDWLFKHDPAVLDRPNGEAEIFYASNTEILYDVISKDGDILKTDTIYMEVREIGDVQRTSDNGLLICGNIEPDSLPGSPFGFAALLDSNYLNPKIHIDLRLWSLLQLRRSGNTWIGFGENSLLERYLFADSFDFSPYVYRMGINEQVFTPIQMSLFPNPAKDKLSIRINDRNTTSVYTVSIVNMLGQTMYSATMDQQSQTIDLTTLTLQGICFVKITDDHNQTVATQKVLIE